VLPSQPLQCHPRCCGNSRQDTTTTAVVRLLAFRQPHPRVSVRTATKWEAPTRPPSKPLLGRYRARHDARRGEIRQDDHQLHGVVHHTTICSLELCGTVVNRLPLAYKRRRRSPGRGGTTDSCTLARFPPSPRYWHFASIKPQGPRGHSFSPALLVAPFASTMVQRNTAPRVHPCWTYGQQPEPG
jgi:hypothetical protein